MKHFILMNYIYMINTFTKYEKALKYKPFL